VNGFGTNPTSGRSIVTGGSEKFSVATIAVSCRVGVAVQVRWRWRQCGVVVSVVGLLVGVVDVAGLVGVSVTEGTLPHCPPIRTTLVEIQPVTPLTFTWNHEPSGSRPVTAASAVPDNWNSTG